ncbi:MAG: hypothetical protein RBS68_03500 [Anaerolineales bacterium]|nr:hypothetical protein [Anaerolineales bacterium]
MGTSPQQVSDFLNQFKALVTQRRFHFVQRLTTNKTALSLGLTETIAKQELLNLSVIDFSSGPSEDRNMPGENFWIFGKEINGCEVYIKLKIYTVSGVEYAKCVSFHEAEYTMKYPFQR